MTVYTVLRFEKLKTLEKAREAHQHVTRERETPNANPKGQVYWAISPMVDGGEGKLEEAIADRLAKLPPTKKKRRSDAVLCVQGVLSASPEYFSDPWDKAKLDAWLKVSVDWLKNEFGSNLVAVSVHLDETTPHLHCFTMPVDKNKQLCAKREFGKSRLRHFQTSYGKAVKHLGIERGIEGSTANHQGLKDFYKNIGKNVDPPTFGELTSFKLTGVMPDSVAVLIDKATAGDQARKTLKATEATLAKVDAERAKLRKDLEAANVIIETERAKNQELAAKYRTINLIEVVTALDCKPSPTKVTGRTSYVLPTAPGAIRRVEIFDNGKGFEIANGLGPTALREKGKNAIDLVKAAMGLDFDQALRWLAASFGVAAAANESVKDAKDNTLTKLHDVTKADLEPVETIKARLRLLRERSAKKVAPAAPVAAKNDIPSPVLAPVGPARGLGTPARGRNADGLSR